MDMGLIGKKYWIVEIKFKDGASLEFTYDTREECRQYIRESKRLSESLELKNSNLVSRKIYLVTIIHENGGEVYKVPKS